jgi:chemotaxis protein MotA
VPEQELAFLKSRILDQTYPKNPKALPETADSALYGSLCILNAKLDQILHLLTLRNEGFNALSSRLVNISGAGLCFTTPEKFAEGDIIEIKTFLSPHKNRALCLYGMIIASEERAEGYRLSLSFVQMDDSVREEIVKFVLNGKGNSFGKNGGADVYSMLAIIGIVIVFTTVIGGYLLEHGNLAVLFQPAEFLIIFGAAIGGFLISSPSKVVKAVIKSISRIFRGKTFDKKDYTEALMLLNGIFYKIRQQGLVSIESDVDSPQESPLFSQYPSILNNTHAIDLITDTLRTVMTTTIAPHELDALIDQELDVYYEEMMQPAKSVNFVADALPGLGIVAAVLGVVLTMGKISEPPRFWENASAQPWWEPSSVFLLLWICWSHGKEYRTSGQRKHSLSDCFESSPSGLYRRFRTQSGRGVRATRHTGKRSAIFHRNRRGPETGQRIKNWTINNPLSS